MINKPKINLSINPIYTCNMRCHFCYLTSEQLSSKTKLTPHRLDELLNTINDHYSIEYVEFYGGEIGLLSNDEFYAYKDIVRKYNQTDISIITNFTLMKDFLFDDDIILSVSYDFTARDHSDKVLTNMLLTEKPLHILTLVTDDILSLDIEHKVGLFNTIRNVETVELKPYSKNQSNDLGVANNDFTDEVIRWLEYPNKQFQFINQCNIHDSLSGEYNAFSDDHLYITPSGNYGLLDFDNNDCEYFIEFDDITYYSTWIQREKNIISTVCEGCEFRGICLTEHYRPTKPIDDDCDGFKELLIYGKQHGI